MNTSSLLQHVRGAASAQRSHVALSSTTIAVAETSIPEAIKHVPAHIRRGCSQEKLVLHAQHFDCPAWADRSKKAGAHLAVSKPATADAPAQRFAPLLVDHDPYYLLGQSEKLADYRLLHPSISRLHCAIVHHREGAVFLVDLNSANGVRLNGTRLAAGQYTQLNDGDEIVLGASTRVLTLRLRPPTPKTRPATAAVAPTAPVVAGEKRRAPAGEPADAAHPSAAQPPQQPPPPSTPEQPAGAVAAAGTSPHLSQPSPNDETQPARKGTFCHLLLKHKDLAQPVSKAPRSKNQPVTRSVDDALRMAEALHTKHFSQPPVSVGAFQGLVEQFSECKSAGKGGWIGVVQDGMFAKEFEDVAFSLSVHEVSRPVTTSLGVHLLLRLADGAEPPSKKGS